DIASRSFIAEESQPAITSEVRAWDGNSSRAAMTPVLDAAGMAAQLKHRAVLLAHQRALPEGAGPALAGRTVWTSGARGWFALAAQGLWVQGWCEGLGAENLVSLVGEPLLSLPPPFQWDVLTHVDALEPWQVGSWAG